MNEKNTKQENNDSLLLMRGSLTAIETNWFSGEVMIQYVHTVDRSFRSLCDPNHNPSVFIFLCMDIQYEFFTIIYL
jgi:hypothetical protein